MAIYKRGGVWWYGFIFKGERIQESTKQSNKRVAEQMEAAHRCPLRKAELASGRRNRFRRSRTSHPDLRKPSKLSVPRSHSTIEFYKRKLKLLLATDSLASAKLDEIDEAVIDGHKQSRSRNAISAKEATFTSIH